MENKHIIEINKLFLIFGRERNKAFRMLMKGNKGRMFCMHLSFIGWFLLTCCCTCGLGSIVLMPYVEMANTAFYDEVSQRSAAKEVEFPSINPDDYNPDDYIGG